MNKSEDIRWIQRFQNFEKSFLLLRRTLDIKKPSEAERGGLIHFYEMTFELAWKLLRDYLWSGTLFHNLVGKNRSVKILNIKEDI